VTTIGSDDLTDTRRYVQTDLPTGSDDEFLRLASGKPDWVALTAAMITDIEEYVEDQIGANIVAGSGISVSYDDPGTGQTTISASGGGAATITVQSGDSTVDGSVTTVDFDASDFTVTSSPAGEVNVSLAYGTSAGTPVEGNTFSGHEHSSFQAFEVNDSRNAVDSGSTNVTSTSGQTILSDTMTLSNGVTYDIYVWGAAAVNAPSGQYIQVRIDLSGTGISGETQPWLGTGTVGGERTMMPYAVLRAVAGAGQVVTVTLQAKVTGGTGSVGTASFLGQALPRGSGGVS
jgi:hypothetical protein